MNNNKNALKWLNSAHFTNDIYTGILSPIMPFIAAKLGITMAFATLAISISNVFSSLLQPIFGFFADNILKRVFIFWGLLLTSIFIPIAPLSQSFEALIIFMILGSLGSSFFHPQASGFVNTFSNEFNDRTYNMGQFISFGSLGYSFGPLIAAFIIQYLGITKMPTISIFGIVLAFMMFLFVPKRSTIEKKPEHKSFKETFKIILSNRKINYLMVISMMKSLISTSCLVLLPFLWKNMNYTPFYIGVALFLFIIAGGFASLLSHKIEKITGTKPLLYFSMVATFPQLVLFAFTYEHHPIISMILFVITGFTTMLSQPVTLVMGQEILPEFKSVIAGIMNGFTWGVVAILLSAIGLFAQKYGITNILVILAIFPILSTPIIKKL